MLEVFSPEGYPCTAAAVASKFRSLVYSQASSALDLTNIVALDPGPSTCTFTKRKIVLQLQPSNLSNYIVAPLVL